MKKGKTFNINMDKVRLYIKKSIIPHKKSHTKRSLYAGYYITWTFLGVIDFYQPVHPFNYHNEYVGQSVLKYLVKGRTLPPPNQ